MNEEEKKAIEHFNDLNYLYSIGVDTLKYTESEYDNSQILLNLLEKKDIDIIEAKEANRQLSIELQKKDKIIDEMAKGIFIEMNDYANPEEVKQYYERKVENGN